MLRCDHGMLRGLCVVKECPHFDGLKSPREKLRTVHKRHRVEKDSPTLRKPRKSA